LIPAEDRAKAVELIKEAMEAGARLFKACEVLDISTATFYRWKNSPGTDRRKGAEKRVVRKLSEEEIRFVIETACSERFKDCNPYEIVAILLDEGTYIASVSTFYRILRQANLLHHRGESRAGERRGRPDELKATGANQVFCWDITYLPTQVRGLFFFAYMIIDVWSRKIVSWEIHTEESAEIAEEMFRRIARERNLEGVRLHSDNGHPMKGATMLVTLFLLGVIPSFSRPRVSNDNPYIESLFKTVKYTTGYPKKFRDIHHARSWLADFVHWYNTEHRHSGIGYMTPEKRHNGEGKKIMKHRNHVLLDAYKEHPERWSGTPSLWIEEPVVYLNPSLDTRRKLKGRKKAA
jgi:transposase InsO family protein